MEGFRATLPDGSTSRLAWWAWLVAGLFLGWAALQVWDAVACLISDTSVLDWEVFGGSPVVQSVLGVLAVAVSIPLLRFAFRVTSERLLMPRAAQYAVLVVPTVFAVVVGALWILDGNGPLEVLVLATCPATLALGLYLGRQSPESHPASAVVEGSA